MAKTNSIKSTEIATVTLSSPVISAAAAYKRRHHHETEPFHSTRCAALSSKRKPSPPLSPSGLRASSSARSKRRHVETTRPGLATLKLSATATAAVPSSASQLNHGAHLVLNNGHAPGGNSFVYSRHHHHSSRLGSLRPKLEPSPEATRLDDVEINPVAVQIRAKLHRRPLFEVRTRKRFIINVIQEPPRQPITSLFYSFLLLGLLLTVSSLPSDQLLKNTSPLVLVTALKSIEDQPAPLAAVSNELNAQIPPWPSPNISLVVDHSKPTTTTTVAPISGGPRGEETGSKSTTLGDILTILKIASPFTKTTVQTTTTTSTTTTTPTPTTKKSTTEETTTPPTTTTEADLDDQDDAGARDDDYDAESCKGISAGESAEAKNLTDNERFINLQACLQKKVKRRLLATTLTGLQMFEKLSLGGGCSASLMNFATSLGETKSFAFKFLDASAKIPSGVMYGLLSDYGDFDQCLSIRSNPLVSPDREQEESAYSGKYCLLNIKLRYRVHLGANGSLPEGIIEDGVLWDELVRNYWTSSSNKGFQMGVCVPSRCANDDLDQIFQYFADSYNIQGEVTSCQDSNDLRRQHTADFLQLAIIYTLAALIVFTILGTLLERYLMQSADSDSIFRQSYESNPCKPMTCRVASKIALLARILICFSINRNWKIFMRKYDDGCDLITASNLPIEPGQEQRPANVVAGPQTTATSTSTTTHSGQRASGLTCETNTTDCSNGGGSSGSSSSSTTLELGRSAGVVGSLPAPATTNQANRLIRASSFINSSIDSADSGGQVETGGGRPPYNQQLLIKVHSFESDCGIESTSIGQGGGGGGGHPQNADPLSHLSGLKLLVIVWITIGHSFLYPSANNYQYYRSIINMNITRDSVWFAGTNFTLGIDTLLYITGLVFVYKTARFSHNTFGSPTKQITSLDNLNGLGTLRLMIRKVLRFWPTYLAVIALALVVPLLSDGPMWPEMVSKRLGNSCRKNWWTNLLIMNNLLSESEICLPSSWFVSVLMQLFLIGSMVIVMVRRFSLIVALTMLTLLLVGSSVASFSFAYYTNIRAPVIRMDESFVMELDENIFRLYTNIFNNMGPFLVGMAGGFLLLKSIDQASSRRLSSNLASRQRTSSSSTQTRWQSTTTYLAECLLALLIGLVAILVLASVFHQDYSRLMSAVYWATHRIGWAIVTGYLVHKCATGKWRLLYDLLSLSTFIPLSRLIFIAYLVYPIFIHVHSGLVRDGLHVSIYNMMNIYITRLVLTFTTALAIHLLVELPFCSLEEMFLGKMVTRSIGRSASKRTRRPSANLVHPLLVVAPNIELKLDGRLKADDPMNYQDDQARHLQSNINQSSLGVNMRP